MLCAAPLAGGRASASEAVDLLALRERLAGTVWSLQLKPMFGEPPPEPLTDTVSFTGGQLLSQLFGDRGFRASDYTVAVETGGIHIWEATQLNPDDGIVIWKGELDGATVRGIVSRHPLEGPVQEFVFIGQEVQPEPAGPEPQDAGPEAPAEDVPPVTPPAAEEINEPTNAP